MTSRETNQGQSEKKKAKTGRGVTGHSPLANRCKGYGGACSEYAEEGREGGRKGGRKGERRGVGWGL